MLSPPRLLSGQRARKRVAEILAEIKPRSGEKGRGKRRRQGRDAPEQSGALGEGALALQSQGLHSVRTNMAAALRAANRVLLPCK